MKYFQSMDDRLNENKNSGLKVYYSNQKLPKTVDFTIFLAGPTYRTGKDDKEVPKSWRAEAVEILKKLNFNGAVLIPEDSKGKYKNEYDDQVEWEEEGLKMADLIVFWIPRDLKNLPGFTTNDEWGYWKGQAPEKLVLGTPKDAEKVKYQEYYAEKFNIPVYKTLKETLKHVLTKQKEYTKKKYQFERTGGERFVPLEIWNSDTFKGWYDNQIKAGNRLDDAKVLWKYYVGPDKNILFLWSLWVKVWIKAEKRHKDNECIVSRFDLSSVVMYNIDTNDIWNSSIVLVKEFRSPVNNGGIYVLENPGGSSFSSKDPKDVIVKEIEEETGLSVKSKDIVQVNTRQLVSTLSIHKNSLFSIELSDEELAEIKDSVKDKVFGVTDDTERTYVEIKPLKELMKSNTLDYAQIGMIMEVIYNKIGAQKIKA